MELIHSGQKISINIEKNDRIVEIIGTINEVLDDRLLVDLPQYFMRYIEYLEVGKPLTAKIFSKMGTIDFNTVVISSPLETAFTIELDYNAVRLTPDEEVPAIEAMEILKVTRENNSVLTLKTTNISIEKIICLCNDSMEVEEKLNCELILPKDYGTITFKATVIKRDIVYDNEYTLSCYGMSEENRQSLLYYMYMYTLQYDEQAD